MNEVIVVHFLRVDDVTVLLLTQVLGVNSIGSQELLVGHAERLTNGLGYELSLTAARKTIKQVDVILFEPRLGKNPTNIKLSSHQCGLHSEGCCVRSALKLRKLLFKIFCL